MRVDRIAVGIAGAIGIWTAVHHTSPAVRTWRPPTRTGVGRGPLHCTATAAQPGTIVLLLHGIVASGRSFGAAYDVLPARVVVPDLLGFGRSMDVPADGYDIADHVGALRRTLAGAGLWDRPTVIVGHSMGGVLALHLAAAHPAPVAVVAVCAPLYDQVQEGLDRIGGADPLAGLLTVGDLAERVCGWMCAHRDVAKALWPLLGYRWPWPVAQDGVLHTWPAYRSSLDALVLQSGWRSVLRALDERRVPIHLVEGADDDVTVPGRASQLAATLGTVRATTVPGSDHALPLAHPEPVCAAVRTALTYASARGGVVEQFPDQRRDR